MMSVNFVQKLKNNEWTIVATAIMAGMIYFADVGKVIAALGSIQLIILVGAVLGGLTNLVLRSGVWIIFFNIEGIESHPFRVFKLFSASRFLNVVTPLGKFGSEPIIAYFISKETDTSYGNALGTVSTAIWVVLIPIALFTLVGYIYLMNTGQLTYQVRYFSMIMGLLTAFGLFMGYLGWFRPKAFRRSIEKLASVLEFIARKENIEIHEKLESFFDHLEESFDRIRGNSLKFLFSIVLATVGYFILILVFHTLVNSVGIELVIYEAMIMIPIASAANISPTPGGSGTVEAALVGLITLFTSAEFATALTLVILYRAATYWVGILVGYLGMATLNLDEHMEEMEKSGFL